MSTLFSYTIHRVSIILPMTDSTRIKMEPACQEHFLEMQKLLPFNIYIQTRDVRHATLY